MEGGESSAGADAGEPIHRQPFPLEDEPLEGDLGIEPLAPRVSEDGADLLGVELDAGVGADYRDQRRGDVGAGVGRQPSRHGGQRGKAIQRHGQASLGDEGDRCAAALGGVGSRR